MGKKKKTKKKKLQSSRLRNESIQKIGSPWPRSVRIPNKKKQQNKEICRKDLTETD